MKRWILALLFLAVAAGPAWASEEIGRKEDTAATDGQVLMPIGCMRSDTPASTTDTDGDTTHWKCTASGRGYTSTLLEAGTAAIGKLAANSGVIIGDVNIAASVGLSVTTLTPGTGATSIAKAEGGTHANGDVGILSLAVRHDVSTTGLGADGTNAALGLNASGELYVAANTELPAAVAMADSVSNASLVLPAVAAYLNCYNGTASNTWSRCPGGLSDTDDGTIATSQVPYLMLNLPYGYDGANWTRKRFDPCESGNKIFVPISQTTSTQYVTGTSSMRSFVCHIHVVSATAQNINLVSGTGSVCATSTGPMIGGTTAGTGWNFQAAGDGIVVGTGVAAVAKSDTDADNICLLQSGAGQVSGVMSYVAATN